MLKIKFLQIIIESLMNNSMRFKDIYRIHPERIYFQRNFRVVFLHLRHPALSWCKCKRENATTVACRGAHEAKRAAPLLVRSGSVISPAIAGPLRARVKDRALVHRMFSLSLFPERERERDTSSWVLRVRKRWD